MDNIKKVRADPILHFTKKYCVDNHFKQIDGSDYNKTPKLTQPQALVNKTLEVRWKGRQTFRWEQAVVKEYDPKHKETKQGRNDPTPFFLVYTDGTKQWYNLNKKVFRLKEPYDALRTALMSFLKQYYIESVLSDKVESYLQDPKFINDLNYLRDTLYSNHLNKPDFSSPALAPYLAKEIEKRKDPNTGATYYYNTRTEKSGWTVDEVREAGSIDTEMEAGDDIEERIDPNTGATYYYNTRTEKSGWTIEEVETNEAAEYGAGRSGASAARSATEVATAAPEPKERQAEAEEKARKEAEEKVRKEAEEKERNEEKARKEAEDKEKARKEAEEQARKEAVERSKKEAAEQRLQRNSLKATSGTTRARSLNSTTRANTDTGTGAGMAAEKGAETRDAKQEAKETKKDAVQELIYRVNSNRGRWYEILGVEHTANEREIKQAFRHASLKLHPDKCKLSDAVEAFKTVNEAYSVLKDVNMRSQYDQKVRQDERQHARDEEAAKEEEQRAREQAAARSRREAEKGRARRTGWSYGVNAKGNAAEKGNACEDNPSRPTVGDKVKLSPSGNPNGCLGRGDFGDIVEDHYDDMPYTVSFQGHKAYYAEKDVVRPPPTLWAAQPSHPHKLQYTTYGYSNWKTFCNGCHKLLTECNPSGAGMCVGYQCGSGCEFNLCLECSGAAADEVLVGLRHYRGQKRDLLIETDTIVTFGRFSTAVSDMCHASSGKWRYEVTILSAIDCTQFGWADARFEPNEERSEKGTGDDDNSWAADGKQALKWHDGKHEPFGHIWKMGDVVGIAIDLDSKPNRLLFGVNDKWDDPLGVAFEDICFRSYLYPALSAQRGTKVQVNFGQTGFAFSPPSGDTSFKPWHSAPKR